ncbi:uncharacterized protein K441DRAFT_651553 [Cenococcum geophilum 1.58]|uniref:uncharacterized protein n=1 Tax=Cenococcum geophilum 1.58 TaxID=794803 RepID=UPI00358FD4E8|nr:hypothetical protein K441DRAFT_651553 [Cenococcum geophilum 1.58]
MALTISLALLSTSVWRATANAVPAPEAQITPAPILQRQNDAAFMGYFSTNGTWTSLDCNSGLTWYQSGNYAQCCPTTVASCIAPTGCISGSQIYPRSGTVTTVACTDNYDNLAWSICNTIFIYENTADSNPHTDIVCGNSPVNWSYYRQIPTSATSSSESSTTPSSTNSSPTATSTSPVPTPSGKKSQAWIAGAVVGPLVGLALLGALLFFLLRKKKTPASAPQPQQTTDYKPGAAAYQQPALSPQYPPQNQYPQQGYQPGSLNPMTPAPQYQHTPVGSPPPQEIQPSQYTQYSYNGATQERMPVLVNQQVPEAKPMAAELSGEQGHK